MRSMVSGILAAGLVWMFLSLLGAAAPADPPARSTPAASGETEDKEAQKALEAKACGTAEVDFRTTTDKKQHPTPEPPPGKAMVYVVRPTMMGHGIQTKLAVDGSWVGANRGKCYFFFPLDPGEHYLCSQAENRSCLVISVEAGKTYYLQQQIKMGFMKARNKLVLLEDAAGKKALADCHLCISEIKK
ncbi:MAG: DUF2846 domain-containing protein [Acidobacteria bacterium]|nr:DUF2846 domain-containing protein [Acidobacteriota bacterium]